MCHIVQFSHFALTLVSAACILSAAPVQATEIIGHRGASDDAPENTVAAFKLGYTQGADGCELDFHATKDHRLIVIHDGTTKRVADVDKKVSEQTFDELRALEVGQWGKWKGKGFTEKLPTLNEALATIPEGRKLYRPNLADIPVQALADGLYDFRGGIAERVGHRQNATDRMLRKQPPFDFRQLAGHFMAVPNFGLRFKPVLYLSPARLAPCDPFVVGSPSDFH